MKKTVIALLVGAMTLTPVVSANAAIQPYMSRYCQYQYADRRQGFSLWEVRLTIGCTTRRFDVSLPKAMAIAERESHFKPSARNTRSGACGIYQQLPRFWIGRLRSFNTSHPSYRLSKPCWNARSNVMVSIWMAHSDNWGPWGG